MSRTNLLNTDRELRIDDQVQDGSATARVVDRSGAARVSDDRGAEFKIEYKSDGATLWLQDNRFEWDANDGWVVV